MQTNLEQRLPFSLHSATIEAEGPVHPAEEYLDTEAVRLRVARELNGSIFPGHEETVRNLAKVHRETPVAYVVWRSGGQRAKCYCDLHSRELLGIIRIVDE